MFCSIFEQWSAFNLFRTIKILAKDLSAAKDQCDETHTAAARVEYGTSSTLELDERLSPPEQKTMRSGIRTIGFNTPARLYIFRICGEYKMSMEWPPMESHVLITMHQLSVFDISDLFDPE